MPPGARYVGRVGRFGNPVRIGHWVSAGRAWREAGRCTTSTFPRTTRDLVIFHRLGIRYGGLVIGDQDGGNRRAVELPGVDEIRARLAGLDLACWCPLARPCHADTLLHLANGGGIDDWPGIPW